MAAVNALSRLALLLVCVLLHGQMAHAQSWDSVPANAIVLVRHALAPGGGDPAGFKLGDCATQRNLSEEGRAQARRLGEQFRARRVFVGAVWTSQWCRTRETAELAFPGKGSDQPAFNSFFGTQERSDGQTREALRLLSQWRGPGVLVVVTHQVNITALTGAAPAPGEGIVVQPAGAVLQQMGRIHVPPLHQAP